MNKKERLSAFAQELNRSYYEDTYVLFHIERKMGHWIDDKYPLSKFLRVKKELENYVEEKNQSVKSR